VTAVVADCDLIALLEDDSGMELLINNKIIALDLPVRDVYKKIWLPNHNEVGRDCSERNERALRDALFAILAYSL